MQLIPALDAGGAERSALEIGRALVAGGHRSVVISAGGRWVATLLAEGSEHICLPIGRKSLASLAAVGRLRRDLQTLQPDIIHVRSRLPAWLAACALWRWRSPPIRVSTVHGLNSVSRYSAIMLRADAVIAVSETVREYLETHYPRRPHPPIRVIPRGVDAQAFPRDYQPSSAWRTAWAAEFPKLVGGRLLVLPGRGTRLKGHRHGLRLLAGLRAQGIDARLWLPGVIQAGREAYLQELQQLASELHVADHVQYSPSRDDVRDIYAQAELILQLSDKPEALGRTVLEALSLGRPVVGFAHGGVGELLARHYPAGAVRLGDQDGLLRTVAAMLQQPLPPPPLTAPDLAAMQAATLQLYQQLAASR